MFTPDKLDSLVETYAIDTVSEQYKRLEFIEKLSRHLELGGLDVVEFGSASGRLTELLAAHCGGVTAVDGSARFIEIARRQVGELEVNFVHSMFENFDPVSAPDLLVMHHILEHVDETVPLLQHIRSFLKPGGHIAITVPNAMALSRQLAVEMGMLENVYALTENDHHHGHQRVYDWSSLRNDVRGSGFEIVGEHGLAFKLFADFQNEKIAEAGIIGDAQFRGLWSLGDRYPEVAGAIMMVAKA